ncbi:MAG: hypothetical protein AABY22_10300 [Nanoarchaeota archaeon]
MKKRYILLKDSPELKKGAILEEKCDNGDQGFDCININEYQKFDDQGATYYSRKTIMEGPDWFEELSQRWFTMEQMKKIKEFFKFS